MTEAFLWLVEAPVVAEHRTTVDSKSPLPEAPPCPLWPRVGVAAILGILALVAIASVLVTPAPVLPSSFVAGRQENAVLADVALWTTARRVIAWSSPAMALALLLWLGLLERSRSDSAPTGHWMPWLALGALWALHAVNNIIWLHVDQRPPYWDMANHLWISLRYLRASDPGQMLQVAREVSHYPPLYYLMTLPLSWILGPSEDVAALINLVALAVLMAATYGIG